MTVKNISPTKGNLMALKKSLVFTTSGYKLLDRKRNILTREMMIQMQQAKELRNQVTEAYEEAYQALQYANMSLGRIDDIVDSIPVDQGLEITYRSVMGVEIPSVHYKKAPAELNYGLRRANSKLDYAHKCFTNVKEIMVVLVEVENSVYRLAFAIRKTQKRANALKNVVIPQYLDSIHYISNELEEKEREEFTRQKVIKQQKNKRILE